MQLQTFMHFLMREAPRDDVLRRSVLSMYHAYHDYIEDGVPCQISVLSNAPTKMTNMHSLMHAEAKHITATGSVFLAAFPRSGVSEEVSRLTNKSESVVTFPGQQKMGTGGWFPQHKHLCDVSLFDTESHAEAISWAVNELAAQWGLCLCGMDDRFCFDLALMNSLPPDHPGAVTYEDKFNILSHAGNVAALRTDHQSSLSISKQPKVRQIETHAASNIANVLIGVCRCFGTHKESCL